MCLILHAKIAAQLPSDVQDPSEKQYDVFLDLYRKGFWGSGAAEGPRQMIDGNTFCTTCLLT